MRLVTYVDDVKFCFKPASIWMSLVFIPKFIIAAIKEEWEFWTFFYPYELSVPPMLEERKAGLRDFEQRMKKIGRQK